MITEGVLMTTDNAMENKEPGIEEKNISSISLKPKVLVLSGLGLNCEYETQHAFELAGANAKIVHINSLASREKDLKDFHILAMVGGFSYGDYIREGRLLALSFKYNQALNEQLYKFIDTGKLIIGICNGYQAMVELGVLPGLDKDYRTRRVVLDTNESGRFMDDWVYLDFDPKSPCVFTKGIDRIALPYTPIRHGAGRLVIGNVEGSDHVRKRLQEQHLIPVSYVDRSGNRTPEANPNGSEFNAAGLCDETGKLFGWMPHAEAATYAIHDPYYSIYRSYAKAAGIELPDEGPGRWVFNNSVEFSRKS